MAMAPHKSEPWSNGEVQTFLCLVADEKIQRELDGATRNEKVYQEVAELMAVHGYQRTLKQGREKHKKLKSDYRAIKDHNGRGGSSRKDWKWFNQMDAIYGHRPGESRLDSATSILQTVLEDGAISTCKGDSSTSLITDPPSSPASAPASASTPVPAPTAPTSGTTQQRSTTGKRKRVHRKPDLTTVFTQMQAEEELHRAQHERHIQLLLSESREAREQETALRREETALRREEMAENAAFNQAFLGVLGKLAEALSARRV